MEQRIEFLQGQIEKCLLYMETASENYREELEAEIEVYNSEIDYLIDRILLESQEARYPLANYY